MPENTATAQTKGKPTLGQNRILIVGCGDVGERIVTRLAGRARVFAVTRTTLRHARLRALGAVPIALDLDDALAVRALTGLAPTVLHLAPPQAEGSTDRRTRHLVAALARTEHLVYVSTSGVYGDCGGALVDESRAPHPETPRGRRRLDAERVLRHWGKTRGVRVAILRVPGIYSEERLPIERIAAGAPALEERSDVHTNHVHAEDLARAVLAALARGAPQRVYHAVDDSALKAGEFFDLVADHAGLPRPRRVDREALRAVVSEMRYSFMSESRRLQNQRMKVELALELRYPTVGDALREAASREGRGRSVA